MELFYTVDCDSLWGFKSWNPASYNHLGDCVACSIFDCYGGWLLRKLSIIVNMYWYPWHLNMSVLLDSLVACHAQILRSHVTNILFAMSASLSKYMSSDINVRICAIVVGILFIQSWHNYRHNNWTLCADTTSFSWSIAVVIGFYHWRVYGWIVLEIVLHWSFSSSWWSYFLLLCRAHYCEHFLRYLLLHWQYLAIMLQLYLNIFFSGRWFFRLWK